MHTVLIWIKIKLVNSMTISFDATELINCRSKTFAKFPVISSQHNSLKKPELADKHVEAGKQNNPL